LEELARTRLLDGLATAVQAMGGSVTVDYRTKVFSGLN
jgi:hypothetical protein